MYIMLRLWDYVHVFFHWCGSDFIQNWVFVWKPDTARSFKRSGVLERGEKKSTNWKFISSFWRLQSRKNEQQVKWTFNFAFRYLFIFCAFCNATNKYWTKWKLILSIWCLAEAAKTIKWWNKSSFYRLPYSIARGIISTTERRGLVTAWIVAMAWIVAGDNSYRCSRHKSSPATIHAVNISINCRQRQFMPEISLML